MNTRHIGKFYVSQVLNETDEWMRVLHLMNFAPIHVKFMSDTDSYEYIGVSPMFEEVSEGTPIPEYVVVLSEENNEISVTLRSGGHGLLE